MHPRHRCSEIAYPEHRFIITSRFFEMHTVGVLSCYFNRIFYYIPRRFVRCTLLHDEQISYDYNNIHTKNMILVNKSCVNYHSISRLQNVKRLY